MALPRDGHEWTAPALSLHDRLLVRPYGSTPWAPHTQRLTVFTVSGFWPAGMGFFGVRLPVETVLFVNVSPVLCDVRTRRCVDEVLVPGSAALREAACGPTLATGRHDPRASDALRAEILRCGSG